MRKPTFVLVLLFAVAGCGGGDGTGNISDPMGAYSALADSVCKKYVSCGVIGASEVASCKQGLLSTVDNGAYNLNEPFNAHRIVIDGNALQTCIDAVAATSCGAFLGAADACQHIIVGQLATGGVCKSNGECAGGYCDRGVTVTVPDGCPGTCKPFVATGAACVIVDQCAPSAYCDILKTNTCLARAPQNAMCTSYNGCQVGLTCTGLGAGAGTCTGPSPAGGACTTQCVSGNYCDTSAMPYVCKAQIAHGTGCTEPQACVDGDVCLGAPNGVCGAWLDVGSVCDPTKTGFASGCPSDLLCDPTSKTCKSATLAVGSDCTTASCTSLVGGLLASLYCDRTTNSCQNKVAFGAACTPNPNGSEPCNGGTCDAMTKVCTLKCM